MKLLYFELIRCGGVYLLASGTGLWGWHVYYWAWCEVIVGVGEGILLFVQKNKQFYTLERAMESTNPYWIWLLTHFRKKGDKSHNLINQ